MCFNMDTDGAMCAHYLSYLRVTLHVMLLQTYLLPLYEILVISAPVNHRCETIEDKYQLFSLAGIVWKYETVSQGNWDILQTRTEWNIFTHFRNEEINVNMRSV